MSPTLRTSVSTLAAMLAGLLVSSIGARAEAQSATPDARNILPAVTLLVDTSGSMERVGQCACTTPGCAECLPTCTNTPGGTNQMNSWATVIAALTGTWPTFTCDRQVRPAGQPDSGYYLPHYAITSTVQNPDGVLDTYATRVKFGLMTFDNIATLNNRPSLVDYPTYNGYTSVAAGLAGDFSYGRTARFGLPGCGTPFGMNNGARNETATGYGRLYSPGPDSSDPSIRAGQIQTELLSLRPYGATPTAPMLDDFEYLLANDPDVSERLAGSTTGDIYYGCRKRYVILLTDGYPNADMRRAPYFCENAAAGGSCPYDEPEVIAQRLCRPAGNTCTGDIAGLFVIGFNVSGDPAAVARLDLIAANGGTQHAYYADDFATLRTALATVLDQAAPGTTSRAVPAISSTAAVSDIALQSQFNAGFNVGVNGGPWSGVLERKRTTCNGTTPTEQRIGSTDRFQDILNARTATRRIYTVVPRNANRTGDFLYGTSNGITTTNIGTGTGGSNGNAHGNGGASCSGGNQNAASAGAHGPKGTPTISESGLVLSDISTSNAGVGVGGSVNALTRQYLNATATEFTQILDWIRGNRNGASRLSDIYHSSPVVVGRPQFNLPDESFNEFRRLPAVANRPTVLYVGTNDGVLHAFAAEDMRITEGPHANTVVTAGDELWAFIPPVLLPQLKSAKAGHTWMVDGTPYVRDVFFRRTPGQDPDGSIYHTVMVLPLGRGGGAYIGLDITDPLAPKFLFQFASPDMGATLGAPAIAQVLVSVNGNLEERALALLPGGAAAAQGTTDCGPQIVGDQWDAPLGCPARGNGTPPLNQGTSNAVSNHRCWSTQGRVLYFVDPATGEVLQQFDDTVFNAPMTGGVGLYSGDTGTVSTRAFMNDADGIMWRIDLSSTNPRNWSAMQFADMFSDLRNTYPNVGQPAYNPPVLSTDSQGQVVIIQGTGNPDYLDGTAPNRVASYTETLTFNSTTGAATVGLTTNWVHRLPQGEQVTGPVQLYNGVAYYSTFASGMTASNACALGQGHICGVDYRANAGGTTPVGKIPTTVPGTYVSCIDAGTNQLVMGVSITQQLSCVNFGAAASIYDPYLMTNANSQGVAGVGGGSFRLTALLSGGGAANNGGSVGEYTMDLPPPQSYTRINGWAGRVE